MKVWMISFAALALACAILPAADDPLQTASDALKAAVDGKKPLLKSSELALAVMTESEETDGSRAG